MIINLYQLAQPVDISHLKVCLNVLVHEFIASLRDHDYLCNIAICNWIRNSHNCVASTYASLVHDLRYSTTISLPPSLLKAWWSACVERVVIPVCAVWWV